MNWEGVEKKKIKFRDLWSMEASKIRFMIGATYDVLPSPQNLNNDLVRVRHCVCDTLTASPLSYQNARSVSPRGDVPGVTTRY